MSAFRNVVDNASKTAWQATRNKVGPKKVRKQVKSKKQIKSKKTSRK